LTRPADLADPEAGVAAAGRLMFGSGPPRVLVNAAATSMPSRSQQPERQPWITCGLDPARLAHRQRRDIPDRRALSCHPFLRVPLVIHDTR
jgi:hypothetical protein